MALLGRADVQRRHRLGDTGCTAHFGHSGCRSERPLDKNGGGLSGTLPAFAVSGRTRQGPSGLNPGRGVVYMWSFPALQPEIAGSGPQREELEREAGRLGLTGRVRFLGWQRDLRPIFRSWDIFAAPSLDEGLPIATLEAMAEGLPVVATSVGGLPELVEEGQNGYLVPPSDVTALTGRLRILMLDPRHRREMGAQGWERARKHFAVDRMVAEISAIYDSLAPELRN